MAQEDKRISEETALTASNATVATQVRVAKSSANYSMTLAEMKKYFTTPLGTYADNDAALSGGLSVGDLYATSAGVLMRVHA